MQSQPVSSASAEHYVWGDGCDGWHLVKDAKLSVIEERMPAGTSEVPHYHRQAQQFFFVLSGKAVVELEGQQLHLSAGEGVHVAPGTPHCFKNVSKQEVHFIVISAPPSHGDKVPLKNFEAVS